MNFKSHGLPTWTCLTINEHTASVSWESPGPRLGLGPSAQLGSSEHGTVRLRAQWSQDTAVGLRVLQGAAMAGAECNCLGSGGYTMELMELSFRQ